MHVFYRVDKVIVSVSIVLQLTFFSSLKKMRIINEKLMNEISSQPNDMDVSYRCWILFLYVYTYIHVCVCGFVSVIVESMEHTGASCGIGML